MFSFTIISEIVVKECNNIKLDWSDQNDFPGQHGVNGFSIDVLIYCEDLDLHQIAFFEYKTMKWHFLCSEQHIVSFIWRYFNKKIDK